MFVSNLLGACPCTFQDACMFEGIRRKISSFLASTPKSIPLNSQPRLAPDTVDVPTKTKRQIQLANCELARKFKAEKQAKEAAKINLETLFWDDDQSDQSDDEDFKEQKKTFS